MADVVDPVTLPIIAASAYAALSYLEQLFLNYGPAMNAGNYTTRKDWRTTMPTLAVKC